MNKYTKILLGLSFICLCGFSFLIYKYKTEYVPYKQYHGPLSSIATLDFILHSCSTKSTVMAQITNEIYNQPLSLPTSTESYTGSTVGSLNDKFILSPCGKYYMIPVQTMAGGSDPYSEPGVININISQILAKHVPGGILVLGAWDKDEQGIFTSIPDAESFVQLKNSDGAPTPYYRAGNNIYTFKSANNAKRSTQGIDLPIPTLMQGVDVSTFIPGITTNLKWVAKDKTKVYINGIYAPEIDSQTVSAIQNSPQFFPNSESFFKDKNHVYEIVSTQTNPKGYVMTSYDAKTFSIVFLGDVGYPNYTYSKDKNGVYFGNRKIIGADPSTFSVFNAPKLIAESGGYVIYSYAKDSRGVYYSTENNTDIVLNADSQTFEPVDTFDGRYTFQCGKDKNAIYSGTTTVSSISDCQHLPRLEE